MKKYFSYSIKNDEKEVETLPQIIPHESFIYQQMKDKKPPTDILTLAKHSYLLFEELPSTGEGTEPNGIVGYLCTTNKQGKSKSLSKDATAIIFDDGTFYQLYKKTDEKIIGYLKTIEPNHYVAVTKPRSIYLLLWLLPLIFIIVFLFLQINWLNHTPIFGEDNLTIGTITPIQVEELNPAYFNIKINATPILENGKMNIRIENSVRNSYNCYVEVSIVTGEKNDIIYKSPLIHPDESLEFATVSVKCPPGVCDGVALFHFYDGQKELQVTSSVKLLIDVREGKIENN